MTDVAFYLPANERGLGGPFLFPSVQQQPFYQLQVMIQVERIVKSPSGKLGGTLPKIEFARLRILP